MENAVVASRKEKIKEKLMLQRGKQRKYDYTMFAYRSLSDRFGLTPACWAFQVAGNTDVSELAAWNWLRRESVTTLSVF